MRVHQLEGKNMRQFSAILIAIAGWSLLAAPTRAQDTVIYVPPAPKTKLEAFETNIGTILIKAASPMGTISASKGVLSVTCKEDKDAITGRKEYGVALGVAPGGQPEDTTLLDYDELDPLLNAIDYLNKVDWTVTSLASFSAAYETKGGFRIAVFTRKRLGTIEIAVRSRHTSKIPILLNRSELAQLRLLIEQSKNKLDALIKGQ